MVTMAVFFTVFEIKRDIVRKTPIFHTPLPSNLHGNLEPLGFFPENFNTNCPGPQAIKS